MLRKRPCHCRIPAGFNYFLDVSVRQGAGDDAVPGVVTEPLPAVVVKVVVHLVAEGGRIVVDLYEIARQIDPLSAGMVSIDEYLVSGTLPVLLLSWFVGKSYLQEKFFL